MTDTDPPAKRKRGRPRLDKSGAGAAGGSAESSVGKEALIAITRELLQQMAPADISRNGLARHADVDPGLIRYYFKDRESLLRTAAEEMTAELQKQAAASLSENSGPPAERIRTRIRTLLDFKAANPFYHRLMIEEMGKSDSAASRQLFKDVASAAVARYRGYMEAGAEQGVLREVDPVFFYMAVIGMCDFFVIASPLLADMIGEDDAESQRRRYAEFICDLVMKGLQLPQ